VSNNADPMIVFIGEPFKEPHLHDSYIVGSFSALTFTDTTVRLRVPVQCGINHNCCRQAMAPIDISFAAYIHRHWFDRFLSITLE
jgi:hypothetical protein